MLVYVCLCMCAWVCLYVCCAREGLGVRGSATRVNVISMHMSLRVLMLDMLILVCKGARSATCVLKPEFDGDKYAYVC